MCHRSVSGDPHCRDGSGTRAFFTSLGNSTGVFRRRSVDPSRDRKGAVFRRNCPLPDGRGSEKPLPLRPLRDRPRPFPCPTTRYVRHWTVSQSTAPDSRSFTRSARVVSAKTRSAWAATSSNRLCKGHKWHPCASLPSGQCSMRGSRPTALITSRVEIRFAGRVRTKPPARPGVEATNPARARAWRILERYPAGTIVRRAISGVLSVASGWLASHTTARRAYSALCEIIRSILAFAPVCAAFPCKPGPLHPSLSRYTIKCQPGCPGFFDGGGLGGGVPTQHHAGSGTGPIIRACLTRRNSCG